MIQKQLQRLFSTVFLLLFVGVNSNAITTTPESDLKSGWIRYQDYKVHLVVPTGWRIERDLFGMPITVMGPSRNGERVTLNIQHTAVQNLIFNHAELKKNKKDYVQGRKEWLATQENASFISEIPYQTLNSPHDVDGFQIGFRYKMRGTEFEEKSIEATCQGRLFFLEALSSAKATTDDKKTLAQLIQQFDCRDVAASEGKEVPSPLRGIEQKLKEKYETPWVTKESFSQSSDENKIGVIKAVIEFYENYEQAMREEYGEESYGFKFKKLRSFFERLFPTATAASDESFNCFFAGWPSKIVNKNGSKVCAYPSDENKAHYTDKIASSCESGQMACNPALFGSKTCIPTDTAEARSHATLLCEAQFENKHAGKTSEEAFSELIHNPEYKQHESLLLDSLSSAQKICRENDYAENNLGLCHTLQKKLMVKYGSSIAGLDEKAGASFEERFKIQIDHEKEFEKNCVINGKLKETEECIRDLDTIVQNADELEKEEKTNEKQALQASAPVSIPQNKNCAEGDCSLAHKITQDIIIADAQNKCTLAEQEKIKKEECSLNNLGGTAASCVGNLVLSMGKSLWGTIKGIGNIIAHPLDSLASLGKGIWKGVKFAGKIGEKAATTVAGWFTSTKAITDQQANKAHLVSQGEDAWMDEFISHPLETLSKIAQAVGNAFKNWMVHDPLCQEWKGTPHFSECKTPGNFGCLSCVSQVEGWCSGVGTVAGEILPAFLTGGILGITKCISTAGKAGKLIAGVSKIIKEVKPVKWAMKSGKKTIDVVSKVSIPIKKLRKWHAERMVKYKEWRAKTLLGKVGVKTAKGAVSVGSSALKATKWVGKKMVVQPIQFLTTKPYIGAQKWAFNKGMNAGETIGSRRLVKAATEGADVAVAIRGAEATNDALKFKSENIINRSLNADETKAVKKAQEILAEKKSFWGRQNNKVKAENKLADAGFSKKEVKLLLDQKNYQATSFAQAEKKYSIEGSLMRDPSYVSSTNLEKTYQESVRIKNLGKAQKVPGTEFKFGDTVKVKGKDGKVYAGVIESYEANGKIKVKRFTHDPLRFESRPGSSKLQNSVETEEVFLNPEALEPVTIIAKNVAIGNNSALALGMGKAVGYYATMTRHVFDVAEYRKQKNVEAPALIEKIQNQIIKHQEINAVDVKKLANIKNLSLQQIELSLAQYKIDRQLQGDQKVKYTETDYLILYRNYLSTKSKTEKMATYDEFKKNFEGIAVLDQKIMTIAIDGDQKANLITEHDIDLYIKRHPMGQGQVPAEIMSAQIEQIREQLPSNVTDTPLAPFIEQLGPEPASE